MPTAPVIDVEALLAPIPGDNPAGRDVRYEGPYDQIQEARREDDGLDRGDWVRGEAKTADWPGVIELCTTVLAKTSKDLQVAAWLTEALIAQHGFAGMRDAAALTHGLIERFWDGLHPTDVEARIGPLSWMGAKLDVRLKAVPITGTDKGRRFAWWHWQEAQAVDNLGRQRAEAKAAALAEGKVGGEQFAAAVAAAPRAHYDALLEDLTLAGCELEALARVVDTRFGDDAPSLLNLERTLGTCRELVAGIVAEKRKTDPDPVPAATVGDVASKSPLPAAPAPVGGPVPFEPRDRTDALRRLDAVAAFFRRTEPHSPVAYLVERAARWGAMPLDGWLGEVIKDGGVLSTVRETLGITEDKKQ